MNYTLTTDNLHIEDSYKVAKHAMGVFLHHIKMTDDHPSRVWNRSLFSLTMEWVCHNFLHRIGIAKERTKDVDLNYPCKVEWVYILGGMLVWVFVK